MTDSKTETIEYKALLALHRAGQFKHFVVDYLHDHTRRLKIVKEDGSVHRYVVEFEICDACGQRIKQ